MVFLKEQKRFNVLCLSHNYRYQNYLIKTSKYHFLPIFERGIMKMENKHLWQLIYSTSLCVSCSTIYFLLRNVWLSSPRQIPLKFVAMVTRCWILNAPLSSRRTHGAADAAVGLCRPAAAAVTLIIHRHLQTVLEPHRLDGEAPVGAAARAAPRLHAHVERNLHRNRRGRVQTTAANFLFIPSAEFTSGSDDRWRF